MEPDFEDVTELAGEEISSEQLFRVCNRYYWAARYCEGRDVFEVACGTGPGLGYLAEFAKSVVAADISQPIVNRARVHYGDRLEILCLDATDTGLPAASFDVILIFEALYYITDPEKFAAECRRLLRPGGMVLVSNANKDLFDFNPSPYSHIYHGVVELGRLFSEQGFETEFLGSTPVEATSLRQRILRPIKAAVVRFNLMPRTMAGKKLLKRLVFGRPVPMPAEITGSMVPHESPAPLAAGMPDRGHKVIYCKATLSD
ncbi:MAG: class I SAM-dependent methyltransferase [Rhizobiaceae bacterium]|uniref:class I SAM-dependent methyltransferase n=1 Tax=Parvibaculum sp. TaxID=2024848 RepID=UPI001B193AD9|nr:class I SAM-dependent methyltransferase [Parvibaculum sp.]MBO6633389.1 class I SAM-dependent methyltransferase [Parvibaculum sp.]MBO6725858.1 class I SAM-dependent methyltransferase [Rhizobiaceae bacterium]